jgi:hypothetical protein
MSRRRLSASPRDVEHAGAHVNDLIVEEDHLVFAAVHRGFRGVAGLDAIEDAALHRAIGRHILPDTRRQHRDQRRGAQHPILHRDDVRVIHEAEVVDDHGGELPPGHEFVGPEPEELSERMRARRQNLIATTTAALRKNPVEGEGRSRDVLGHDVEARQDSSLLQGVSSADIGIVLALEAQEAPDTAQGNGTVPRIGTVPGVGLGAARPEQVQALLTGLAVEGWKRRFHA